jgi:predicted DNA-binding protein
MNDQMTTARLPQDVRNKLIILSKVKGKTKSDIIKESLEIYYEREESEIDSFTLGEPSFGKYGSGESDRATNYRQRIKEKLSAKQSRTNNPQTRGADC